MAWPCLSVDYDGSGNKACPREPRAWHPNAGKVWPNELASAAENGHTDWYWRLVWLACCMKICHVITRLIIGGAQENTILTCRGLVDLGHEVTLVAGPETGPEGSLWDDARRSGCDIVTVESLGRAVRPLRDVRARRALAHLFRQLQPDVVHTHSSKAGIIGRSAAYTANVPVVVHTIHGMSFNRTQSPWTYALYRSLERLAAKRTSALITVADSMIDQAVRARVAPRDRFITIRSGMRTDRYERDVEVRAALRRDWGVSDGEVVVGTVARLFEHKGYEEIIAAMPDMVRRVPGIRFVWVGDGSHRGRYEGFLRRLGLRDRVHMTGLVPSDDAAKQINGFDILLHASRWEGLPRVLVQGLLTEVVPVSFDNDGAPEVVVPNETGLLAPFGDTGRLAAAVATLATDPDLRARLGCAGRRRCVELFDWRTMAREIETVYARCLEAAVRPTCA